MLPALCAASAVVSLAVVGLTLAPPSEVWVPGLHVSLTALLGANALCAARYAPAAWRRPLPPLGGRS